VLTATSVTLNLTSMNPADPPPPMPSRRPQISLALVMLLMVVFAVFSAGLLYMSRVPAIQSELSSFGGGDIEIDEDIGRTAHLMFIMFTFTSPLILAIVVSTALAIFRRLDQSG